MELGKQQLVLTKEEARALSDLGLWAQSSGPKSFQDRSLAEARRIANGHDARHVLALYELQIGGRRQDNAMRARALDVLISSKLTEREKLPRYLMVRGQIAILAGDYETAGRMWSRLAELTPADPDVFVGMAQVRMAKKDAPGAMKEIAHAISVLEATDRAAPEAWYRLRVSFAQQGQLVGPGIEAAQALVRTHPTPANWRDALVVYRDLTKPEGAFEIDLLRFMRHKGAIIRADEYRRMAQLLKGAGEPEEAKLVLAEGITRGLLDAETWPTRGIIDEVDRAIVESPGRSAKTAKVLEDSGTTVRLGVSKVFAGQRAEAEAAFISGAQDRTAGRYADLASFWLIALREKQAVHR